MIREPPPHKKNLFSIPQQHTEEDHTHIPIVAPRQTYDQYLDT